MKKIIKEGQIKPTATANVDVGKVTSIDEQLYKDINDSAISSKVKVTLLDTNYSGMSVTLSFTNLPNDKTELKTLVTNFANTLSGKGYKEGATSKGYYWKTGQDNTTKFAVYNVQSVDPNFKIDFDTATSSDDVEGEALKIMTAAAQQSIKPVLQTESFNYEINRIKNLMNL